MTINEVQKKEISTAISQSVPTKRPVVSEMESILYQPIPVLDHGFIRVVDYMGDDAAIVQAARVSYGKGTKKVNQDAGLINYLLRHQHTTPFEMCEIKFHLKMPVFIARQWIRHRTANVNEYSARYSVLDNEFYIPEVSVLSPQSKNNHQGRSNNTLSKQEAERVLEILKKDAKQCYGHYLELMNVDEEGNMLDAQKQGIARELARINLPVNIYTQWYWKIDLHNLMHFLKLRADSHAQYEIQLFAKSMIEILRKWVPITHDAFMHHQVGAKSFSKKALNVIKRRLNGEEVTEEQSGMSAREWRELEESLR